MLPEPAAPTVRHSQVSFQYLGSTALTAMGAVTSTRYRFDSPGAIVVVDIRDQTSLRAIPQLRPIYVP